MRLSDNMAANKNHVDVTERRLRPIYDALDNLNNKQAVQLVDKILKKQKDCGYAKALKAVALLRMKRTDECIKLLEEVRNQNVYDDTTLQAMTICYKEMQNAEKIAEVYEIAVKHDPKHEEFLSHLFMSYVRIGNYAKQQQVAMNLHKVHSKNPYYFWAVMSIYMQAVTCADVSKKKTLLTLANKMIKKLLTKSKLEAEAETQLYLMILEQLGEYNEALSLLEKESQESCFPGYKAQKTIEFNKALGKWDVIVQKYKEMLTESPDEWLNYEGYFEAVSRVNKQDDGHQIKFEECMDYLKSLEKGKTIREPFLAQIKLICNHSDDCPDFQKQLQDNLLMYFKQFGNKNCCYTDVSGYLENIAVGDREKFVLSLSEYKEQPAEGDEKTEKEKLGDMSRDICIECIAHRLGIYSKLSSADKLAKAKELLSKHKEGLELGANLISTDIQPSDPYSLLASYLLLSNQSTKTEIRSTCWHVLLILEDALKSSQSNHHIKLLLSRIYFKLGVFSRPKSLFEEVEMKHIMLDTLGYYLTRCSGAVGHFQTSKGIFQSTVYFFRGNQRETPEQIISAYKYGSFHKIEEIIEFKNRLDESFQFCFCLTEQMHLNILTQNTSPDKLLTFIREMEILDKIPLEDKSIEKLRDNRDFDVFVRYTSHGQNMQQEKEQSFNNEMCWLKIRRLTLRCFGVLCTLDNAKNASSVTNGTNDLNPTESLELCLNSLKSAVNIAKETCSTSEKFSIDGPFPTRFNVYERVKYFDILQSALHAVASSASCEDAWKCEKDVKAFCETTITAMKDSFSRCESELSSEDEGKRIFNGLILEDVVALLELSSYLGIILTAGLSTRKDAKLSKRNRKKGSAANETAGHILLRHMMRVINELRELLSSLCKALNVVNENIVIHELEEMEITKLYERTNSETVLSVWQNVQSSYQQSLEEICQLMKKNVSFLGSI